MIRVIHARTPTSPRETRSAREMNFEFRSEPLQLGFLRNEISILLSCSRHVVWIEKPK